MAMSKASRSAGLCVLSALCCVPGASVFVGCAVDDSQPDVARQAGESSLARAESSGLSSPTPEDAVTATSAIEISVEIPHDCDLGFVGGFFCDIDCKAMRGAKCGYCTWNADERRNQCQCYSNQNSCSK
jgi:hypothetical protein